ncbi:S1/P1 nuclease [Mucilaginibacter sp. HMF5004]|uniref:S1/P1 nuclease n=1 Tax=Mucilaginibacter rivuli TaxID=2857527 RepID=UPI001C5EA92D|nr:S1/P1 nuclease [Mucilaginibacter rivuli]MBW4891622.1 S1/P1 nuclease [Mucilaginibacter rivuli]
MKRSITIAFLLVISLTASINNVFAWGKAGHQMVAEVAFNYLDAATKAKILQALNSYNIEQAATWMDDVRGDASLGYMKSWHFVNIDKGAVYKTHGSDAAFQLNRVITALMHKATLTADTVKRDLLILFHLMGDLHQPLHVGYGTDLGGNKATVSFLGKPNNNLHHVWDGDIIYNKKIKLADCIKANSTYTPAQIAAIQKVDVMAWLTQSRAYLNTNVYTFQNATISQAYIDHNAPVIEKQIGIAGLRLAGILKAAFK